MCISLKTNLNAEGILRRPKNGMLSHAHGYTLNIHIY